MQFSITASGCDRSLSASAQRVCQLHGRNPQAKRIKTIRWQITEEMTLAGGIAGTEVMTKVVLFYLHERVA